MDTEPGVRKNDLVGEIYQVAMQGGEDEAGRFGGDYPAIAPMLPTGKDAGAAHLTWDDRPFERGAGAFFELAGCCRCYHVSPCRSIFLGEPPFDMRAAEEAPLEGIHDGIEAAQGREYRRRRGPRLCAVLARHGVHREGRCGYPTGLSYPPDRGERTFSIRDTDDTGLRPNMTFHFAGAVDGGLEPGDYGDLARQGNRSGRMPCRLPV